MFFILKWNNNLRFVCPLQDIALGFFHLVCCLGGNYWQVQVVIQDTGLAERLRGKWSFTIGYYCRISCLFVTRLVMYIGFRSRQPIFVGYWGRFLHGLGRFSCLSWLVMQVQELWEQITTFFIMRSVYEVIMFNVWYYCWNVSIYLL